ncbi:MAG: hypothetical protein LQ343_007944 [Gyalolechia ehrenbergii]|nr:MAG: hypothetical protein LQ343_007944 [Gyalolechia ehrenbergii]
MSPTQTQRNDGRSNQSTGAIGYEGERKMKNESLFFLFTLAIRLILAALPIIPSPSNTLTPTITETESEVGNYIRQIYPIPSSPITISLFLDPTHPIPRPALGHTILRGQQSLRAYLSTHPDNWLAPHEWDPFEVDYLRTGKCFIGLQSLKVGGPGKERLTYNGVLDVLGGLWDVLYLGRREWGTFLEVRNGTVVVGRGKVVVGNVPVGVGWKAGVE